MAAILKVVVILKMVVIFHLLATCLPEEICSECALFEKEDRLVYREMLLLFKLSL